MASVIKSPSSHVASAISFSATIGLLQVIFLPFLFVIISITEFQYGIIAGLSVYAVPQVVAASFVVGSEAGLIATQVKLLRVLIAYMSASFSCSCEKFKKELFIAV